MSSKSVQQSPHRITKTIWLPDIEWIEIPAGDFLFGEDNQSQFIDRFYISKYPVTNRQYQTFVDDGGYKNERWWKNLKMTRFEESEWPQPNRPKINVDWFEAIAFSRWLSKQLDFEVTLPIEQQWEKAARGTDGRSYPWGDQFLSGYANVNEKVTKKSNWYLGGTTAVGIYPHGQSPYGVHDMSGNVWEWCLNKYDNPKLITVDVSDEYRVMRGGSWMNNPAHASADIRHREIPAIRDDGDGGFRVVCVLPSADH